ncbi:hypothetical protein CH276_22640 [Rhodococcus sp. 06-470-2]|uniref:hypothetical protein n=1 Tax=unclassified Rhodococcus (in: high G+C Gram-positive bacteria) TaxID=192944 RepID=UPI000B9C42D8|nr:MULTISPECIES: hypothetical protein [unclassified Rhodococcus (in: high G+C Gram-positive bacteria)]OZC59248.1 hypothetical protein CH276_22640 [Rhodococcus sp. 06-470-2]OZE66835.1 hypothetical protein CH265_07965 [Rhodococcus sp. 05-2221-1B]
MTGPSCTFQKRPVRVQAIQWTGDNPYAVRAFTGVHKVQPSGDHYVFTTQDGVDHAKLYVAANDAWLEVEVGEWIIRDEHGYYPCKAERFIESYEPVIGL